MAVKFPNMDNDIYLGALDEERIRLIMDVRGKQIVTGLKNYLFDFPPQLILRSLEEGKSIRRIIHEENMDYSQYVSQLRDYQTVGTGFMWMSPRSILGDAVGAGKTAQISALFNLQKERNQLTRFLMAVETSALAQTQIEIMRFTGLNVVQLPSEAAKMEKVIKNTDWNMVDGIITKHSALRSDYLSNWLALNITDEGVCRLFNTFILDESSVIKNNTTKTYKYTENICNLANRVHYMNATPFETSLMDVYYQLDMMDNRILPKKWRIEKEYCSFGKKSFWTRDERGEAQMNFARKFSKYKNEEKFKESIKLFYFGRSLADIGLDRPHEYKVYEVEPTNAQSLALAKGHRYMEVLNCPSKIPALNIPFDRKNVPKLDRLLSLVEGSFSNQKIMVYCFHLDAQQVIANELTNLGRKTVIINGEDTDDQVRWNKVKAFNTGEKDVIITNIKKSLNLYGGDVCIFYTVETNPAKMEQIRGRIARNVDDSIKTFVLLVYKGTDEHKFLTQVVKQRARDARNLIMDAKTAVDHFMEDMENVESE